MSGYIGNIPVPEATQTRESFTATASQTTFSTSGYTPGYLDVYMNGVHLAPADYTATNGTDVVLTTAAAADDVIDVVAWTVFNPMNVSVSDITDLTATATEINVLDGITATTTELNYCDGVTSNIQTQIDNISTDVVSDTTPQLGGNLDTNGSDITFGDNDKAIFGAGSDLQIYHDGGTGKSYIRESGSSNLVIEGANLNLNNEGSVNPYISCTSGSDVKIAYAGNYKFATTSTGINVTGLVETDDGTLTVHNGVDGTFKKVVDQAYLSNTNERNTILTSVSSNAAAAGFQFMATNGGGSAGQTEVAKLCRSGSVIQNHFYFSSRGHVESTSSYAVPSSWATYMQINSVNVPAGYEGYIVMSASMANNYEAGNGQYWWRIVADGATNYGTNDMSNGYGYHSNFNPGSSYTQGRTIAAGSYNILLQVIRTNGTVTLTNWGGKNQMDYELWIRKI